MLQKLGILYPCDHNELMIPFAMIFPLQVLNTDLYFVTDWHPNVLGVINVGCHSDGAVMYIGPDSLALVQHFSTSVLKHYLQSTSMTKCDVLDLCCGSGIQSIANLAVLHHYNIHAHATCVDVNPRALRFTKFNALLNGYEDNITTTLQDLLDDDTCQKMKNTCRNKFDLIVANPPFIPAPPPSSDSCSISSRYGLFSSAGSTGEEILQAIIEISPFILNQNGIVSIVSEFMNPDIFSRK